MKKSFILLPALAALVVVGGVTIFVTEPAWSPLGASKTDANDLIAGRENGEGATAETEDTADTTAKDEAKVEPEASEKGDYVIVSFGKEEIHRSEAEEAWKSLFPGGSAPDFDSFDENTRQNVLRGLITEKLIYREALNDGFDESEEVKKRLEALKEQIILQSYIENKSHTLVTEKQLQAAYQKYTDSLKGKKEVKASHILVEKEEEAKNIRQAIKDGADFAKLAQEKSLDTSSAKNGGDLGYFTEGRMVPNFSKTAFSLKPGKISEPVKTDFGWHIIRVEDQREMQPRSFEEMRESLRAEVSNEAVQEYVETLIKGAEITYYSADGSKLDFNPTAPAAGAN